MIYVLRPLRQRPPAAATGVAAMKYRFRYWVVALATERIATENAPNSEAQAEQRSMLPHRLKGIMRATWLEAA